MSHFKAMHIYNSNPEGESFHREIHWIVVVWLKI